MAILKGSGDGLRYDLGNVASIWLILPAVAGVFMPRATTAAVVTAPSTFLCLGFFYLVADHFDVSPWAHVLDNRLFFLLVGSSGAATFAALTHVASRSRPLVGAVPLGVVCLVEPFLISVLARGNSVRPLVDGVELACGLILVAAPCVHYVYSRTRWAARES